VGVRKPSLSLSKMTSKIVSYILSFTKFPTCSHGCDPIKLQIIHLIPSCIESPFLVINFHNGSLHKHLFSLSHLPLLMISTSYPSYIFLLNKYFVCKGSTKSCRISIVFEAFLLIFIAGLNGFYMSGMSQINHVRTHFIL